MRFRFEDRVCLGELGHILPVSFSRLPQSDIPSYKRFVHVWGNISLWTSVLCDEHQQNKAVLTAHTCSLKWHPESGCYRGFDTRYWYTIESQKVSSFRRRPKSLTIFIVNWFFAPWNIVLQQWMVTVQIFQDTERLQQRVNAMLVNSFSINAFHLMEPYCSYIVTTCMFCVKTYAFPR